MHLLALAGCFLVAGYAADRLVPSNPLGVGIWFLGAVVGHDLVLMPLYALGEHAGHRQPRRARERA